MKREIYCRPCEERASFLKSKYPNEFSHVDRGDSKTDCRCDFCGKEIKKDSPISAISMGRGTWQPIFSNWTKEFLTNFENPNGEYFP